MYDMLPLTPLFRLLSPANRRARLSILILHRVHRETDPLFPGEPDARWFDEMLGWIKNWFNVLPLDEAVAQLQSGSLPSRAAAITFDDGYADNLHVALPILQKHGLSATVFVATGFLNGGIMWNDSVIEMVRQAAGTQLDFEEFGLGCHRIESVSDRQNTISSLISRIKYLEGQARIEMVNRCVEKSGCILPGNLMMTSGELRQLRHAGMCIGAHTIHHPILARLSSGEARQEIQGCKEILTDILREPVSLFAYPNGKPGTDYLPEHVQMVRETGFSAAVSTVWGAANGQQDLYQLPRFTPWDRSKTKFGLRMARNLARAG